MRLQTLSDNTTTHWMHALSNPCPSPLHPRALASSSSSSSAAAAAAGPAPYLKMASTPNNHGPREGASGQGPLQRTPPRTRTLASKALSYLASSTPSSHASASPLPDDNGYPPLPEGISSTPMTEPSSAGLHAVTRAGPSSRGDRMVLDIEACIDDPLLAPLGRHVHKRSTPRSNSEHVDINIVHPRDRPETDKDTHTPVTSLILRRRRLDRDQLDAHLKSLQPTLDPSLTKLQSPLLHLTELDLSRNRLASLPDDLTSLAPRLQYLNLSHNQLSEIPLSLCHLTHLQVLILSHNRLSGPIPHQIFACLTQLKTLKLCANQITELPHTLGRLTKLETLILGSVYGGNLLTGFPPNCLRHMTSLLELDLSHNLLMFLPSDIGHPESRLRHLTATDNKLEAIPKSIGMCRHLKSLNLGRNQLTSLPTEIADLKQLDTLDLSENLLCIIPADVADFLTKTTLLLTGNPFTRGYCDANRNASTALGGIGVNAAMDEERYSAVLHNLSRRAILNAAAASSSSTSLASSSALYGSGGSISINSGSSSSSSGSNMTVASPGRVSPHPSIAGDPNYDMEHDERLDYHLYYTRHAMSSRPPSRAESVQSFATDGGDYGASHGGSWNDPYGTGGGGTSTPHVNAEAFIHDLESYFERVLPSPRPTASASASVHQASTSTHHANVSNASFVFSGTATDSTMTASDDNQSESSFSTATTPESSPPPGRLEPPALISVPPSSTTSSFAGGASQPLNRPSVQPLQGPTAAAAASNNSNTPTFFPSLKELAARTLLYHGHPLPLDLIPETVVDFLQPGARACGLCRQPYVKEWVSSICVKSYLGHPRVARRVRFCSLGCWHQAKEQSDAEESSSAAVATPTAAASTTGLPVTSPPAAEMGVILGLGIAASSANSLSGSGGGSAAATGNVLALGTDVPSTTALSSSLLTSTTGMDSSKKSTASAGDDGGGRPIGSQSMRVCKGGQTYWPVIARNPSYTFEDIEDVATGEPGHSTAKRDICVGGCQGGGACEW